MEECDSQIMKLDRGQAMVNPQFVTLLVVALVGVLIFNQVWALVTSDEVRREMQETEAWCEGKGGDLYSSHAVLSHGGLHCEFPNGTNIHMEDVPEDRLDAALNQTVTPPSG